MNNNGLTGVQVIRLVVAIVTVVGFLIATAMWGLPRYIVYQKNLRGQAELQQQEWEKKILIEEAKAKKESAFLLADTEVARARGVAEANTIIGDSLKGNEAYLRYLWISGLHDGSSKVIYIPTEAGMPILEAGKR